MRDCRLSQRIVILLRVFSKWRIDEHLHLAIENEIDAVRPALVNLEDPGNRDSAAT